MRRPEIALDTLTIKPASLERKLDLAGEAGFPGVSLQADEVEGYLAAGRTTSDIAQMMARFHVAPVAIGGATGWLHGTDTERRQALVAASRLASLAQSLGCDLLVAAPLAPMGDPDEAASRLRALCETTALTHTRCGLELTPEVKDVATAWRLAHAANHPGAGLILDTFHFCQSGSRLEDLAKVPAERIFLVQVSDAEDGPPAHRRRVLPGEGVLPLGELLGVLRELGYGGYFSLKVPNEGYWHGDLARVVIDGHRALADALRDAGWAL